MIVSPLRPTWCALILCAVVSGFSATSACAQNVLANGDFPDDWAFPFAPALTNPADRINQGNVTAALRVNSALSRDAQVNPAGGNINDIQLLRYDGAPVAMYELQVRLTITGESDANFARNSDVGSGVTVRAGAADAIVLYGAAPT